MKSRYLQLKAKHIVSVCVTASFSYISYTYCENHKTILLNEIHCLLSLPDSAVLFLLSLEDLPSEV